MTARKLRFYVRACARRQYVDPILYREGWYAGPNDAARQHLGAATRIRLREVAERIVRAAKYYSPVYRFRRHFRARLYTYHLRRSPAYLQALSEASPATHHTPDQ